MSDTRYLEDFRVGETFETAARTLTLETATEFARLWDPQPFHTDPDGARSHPVFQGLAASGYLTMAFMHRLIVDAEIGHAWGLVGKEIDHVRWKRPVRPGETLRVLGRVAEIEADPRRPIGTMAVDLETINERDEVLMTMRVRIVVPQRSAALAAE
ncbi:MaoC/PaaZ C-terminal domain-containing protein [Phenylobacterium sp.]|jgi:acyl dehydratase|uniref:MaoC/PaaZ C-terminal domain-containing protein n=1 Tax=Phenylobacterium sp. TaxID=1871053 RepID=UPI002F93FD0F